MRNCLAPNFLQHLFFMTMRLQSSFKYIFATTLFLQGIGVLAQPVGSSDEIMLKVAEERMEQKDYYNALDWYEKYYDKTKDKSVAYQIGMMHYNLRDYVKAETWLNRVLTAGKRKGGNPNEYPDAGFHYGRVLKMNEKYDDAIVALEDFLAKSKEADKIILAKNEIIGAKMAAGLRENAKLLVENMPNKINTPNAEYSPTYDVANSALYFTAYRKTEIAAFDGKDDAFAKVYRAFKSPRGWAEAEVLSDAVNRPSTNQGNVHLSPDGKILFFTRTALEGNTLSDSKIYYCLNSGGNWSPANEVQGINGNYIAKQPCVGELFGKEVLYFSSNMPGTKGGFDIFYATKKSDGVYDTPVNLGAVINTVGNEETPFYAASKLHFSSNGHPGIGGYDVFSADWNGAQWDAPKNMGKGYNSPADDLYYTMNKGGQGFVVSNRVGTKSLKSKTCCDDIFSLQIEQARADLKAYAFSGSKRLDGITFQLAEVEGNGLGKVDWFKAPDNEFLSGLALNKSYRVVASKDGFASDTIYFNTVGLRENMTYEKRLNLEQLVAAAPPAPVKLTLKALAQLKDKPLKNVTYRLTEKGGKTESRTGDELFTQLVVNKTYLLIGERAKCIADTIEFSTNGFDKSITIEKMLKLRPMLKTLTKTDKINLPNIYYKLSKFAANDMDMDNFYLAQQSLDYLYGIMAKFPEMRIELSSHTDAQGSDASNLILSQKRADGAKQYLINKGVVSERIVAKGYGETQIINHCKNGVKCADDEHKQNRRTEFRIISGPTEIAVEEQVEDF
jgi:outer membrane protein OmpA-like peptidoglycan-associated protein/tetratricopeptide (TPR) repeat protein